MKKKILISVLIVAALGVGALIGSTTLGGVRAQTDVPTDEIQAYPSILFEGCRQSHHGARSDLEDVPDNALADKLGVTVEDLAEAHGATFGLAIDHALSAGWITQAQAEELKGESGENWRELAILVGDENFFSLDQNTLLAEALGITPEALEQARSEVRAERASEREREEDGTCTQEQLDLFEARSALAENEAFNQTMKDAMEAALRQAVEDGVISQAQADLLLSRYTAFGGFGYDMNQIPGRGTEMMGRGMFEDGEFTSGGGISGDQDGRRDGEIPGGE